MSEHTLFSEFLNHWSGISAPFSGIRAQLLNRMRNDAQIVVAIFGALSRFAAEADLGTSVGVEGGNNQPPLKKSMAKCVHAFSTTFQEKTFLVEHQR